MRFLIGLAMLATATAAAPAADAAKVDPFPYCRADRVFVVYEASESFVLHGATEQHDAIESTIRCSIRRFGTEIRVAARTAPGPASAVANYVGTPYGGMEVCTYAEHRTATGVTTFGPSCTRIKAP